MELSQCLAQAVESACRRLDYEQPLRCRLDFAFPAIYRLNLGNDINACCQLPLNQRACDAASFFERTDVFVGSNPQTPTGTENGGFNSGAATSSSNAPGCFHVLATTVCGPENEKSPDSVGLPSIMSLNSAIRFLRRL